MRYTDVLRDIIDQGFDDVEIDEEKVLSILNNEDSQYGFMDFPRLLRRFVSEKRNVDESLVMDYFKEKAKEKDISFNRNTINNWFNKTGPKKSKEARNTLYKIAFTLELSCHETIELFSKVYKDRAFNVRIVDEFVYYVCLNLCTNYQTAEKIIGEAKQLDLKTNEGHTIHTKKILSDMKQIHSKDDILVCIKKHANDFCTNNESAIRILNGLLDEIKIKPEEISLIEQQKISKRNSIMAQEVAELIEAEGREAIAPNIVLTSNATMLTIIYGENFRKVKKEFGKSYLKEAKLPKDIITRLPTEHTFSKKDPSYEELRKMIILMASYKFWYYNYKKNYLFGFEDYQDEINSYLDDANMPLLYLGNPFDWLFVYCGSVYFNSNENPLDVFRDLIGDCIFV